MSDRLEKMFTDDAFDVPEEDIEELVGPDNKEDRGEDRINNIFRRAPMINAIDKEHFDKRVAEVFKILGDTLAKSYGPYGSRTFIAQYPYYWITKDGFTIQKNLAFDKTVSFTDQIICGMISDVCGRLNYSVGDGTTTAVVATNSIYQAYRSLQKEFQEHKYIPRDIMETFDKVKDYLISHIYAEAKSIKSDDPEVLAKYIHDIVFVSSNGNEEITEIITDLYRELRYPAIDIVMSDDGITREKIINGFQIDATIMDKLYVNTDENTMELKETDVIIFDHRVGRDTYEGFLKSLNIDCRNRNRHLIVMAPYFDDSLLKNRIAPDFQSEYQKYRDINMVLMVYKNTTAHHKKMISNLAMLLNTSIITRDMDIDLQQKFMEFRTGEKSIREGYPINVDHRGIWNSTVLNSEGQLEKNTPETKYYSEYDDDFVVFRLGFVRSCVLGFKESIFQGFEYDEFLYEKYLNEAIRDLHDTEKRYQRLGTFNLEIAQAEQRLNALEMHIGKIEVGADSEYSRGYVKDTVDDAVKASKSAFNFGVVNGCNVTLLRIIWDLHEECKRYDRENGVRTIEYYVSKIILNGFIDVYRTIINNMDIPMKKSINTDTSNMWISKDQFAQWFSDPDTLEIRELWERSDVKDTIADILVSVFNRFMNVDGVDKEYYLDLFTNEETKDAFYYAFREISRDYIKKVKETVEKDPDAKNEFFGQFYFDVADYLIYASIFLNKVIDITTGRFTDTIINSVETDVQILRAVTDLINILITGNQLVISIYGQFNNN